MPGDIYFNKHTADAKKRKQENTYTEKIELNELKKDPVKCPSEISSQKTGK